MGRKYESEFYEDRDTVTAITDIGEISKDDMWEVYDKKRRTFIDKSKWSNDAVATWLADLQMWTGKAITAEDYRKILGDKAKESKVLKKISGNKTP